MSGLINHAYSLGNADGRATRDVQGMMVGEDLHAFQQANLPPIVTDMSALAAKQHMAQGLLRER